MGESLIVSFLFVSVSKGVFGLMLVIIRTPASNHGFILIACYPIHVLKKYKNEPFWNLDEIYTSFRKGKKIQFHGKMLVRIFLPRSANFLFYGSAFLSTQFFRARISLSSHIRYSNDRKFIKLLIRIWGKSNELNFEKLHNRLFW